MDDQGTSGDTSGLDEVEPSGGAEEEPIGAPAIGVSSVAIPADAQWNAKDRPKDWQGRVYGLVVHTTGGGLPAKALANGVYHTVQAVRYYSQSHGCHYVNGWRGSDGGDLLQMANESEQANGVGISNAQDPSKDQRRSVEAGRFEADLPEVVVRLWRERWPGVETSLDLLPGTQTANSCYVHVECVPCVYHAGNTLRTDAEPLADGLRFTKAQHDTVALLAVDLSRRNGWPIDEEWWRTPRLLGHEDLTPIARFDKNGCWDPGFIREEPYFDWNYVYEQIAAIQGGDPSAPALPDIAAALGSAFAGMGDLFERFWELLRQGQESAAIAEAKAGGITDVNELTNLVFFARHPEMNGRRIETHETALADEWLDIRENVVKPALG